MEDLLSVDSTSEEVSKAFSQMFELNEEEKGTIIREGISGDVLLEIEDFEDNFDFSFGHSNKIEKYLKENRDKFKPKEIKEKISIKIKEEIKSFFEKYIGFKGDIDNIKGENDLKQLTEEDMEN